MEIRPATRADLNAIGEIDGTIESTRYLHLEQSGEGVARSWRIEQRSLREKLILPNCLGDEAGFTLKQVLSSVEEGMVLVAEHEGALAAALLARPRIERGTLHIVDVRVDYEFRRQGIGMAMVYQVIQHARESELRAVSIHTQTNNLPACALLAKCGFELSGLDTRRQSNHDMVKEAATLFWYAALD